MLLLKRKLFTLVIIAVVGLNAISFFHAYKFTHFSSPGEARTNPEQLTVVDKVAILAFGIDNPRPVNTDRPSRSLKTIEIPYSKDTIECWHVPVDGSKGTVLIFHGYAGNKSQMVKESDQFNELGYSTILVDFLGSGGSTGNNTTIGFYESDQVKRVFDYFTMLGEERIMMFGTSMGAVAIMKSIYDFDLNPECIILECPFGNMLSTVEARFKIMNAPSFPASYLLTFWGGVQNGFNAFQHNPSEYAKEIKVKTLLLYGMEDDRVSMEEAQLIFKNLKGPKELKCYREAGHESILDRYKAEWIRDVVTFVDPASSYAFGQKSIVPGGKEEIVYRTKDLTENFYLALIPEGQPKGLLVILPGFGTLPRAVLTETRLPFKAQSVGYLVVIPYLAVDTDCSDDLSQRRLISLIPEVIAKYRIPNNRFVIGGHSIGGNGALLYAESALKLDNEEIIKPDVVFAVDPPLDMKRLWESFVYHKKIKFSETAVMEADYFLERFEKKLGGSPFDKPAQYEKISSYYRDAPDGGNAKYLKSIPIRLYCDPDVNWYIENRRTPIEYTNMADLSALIVQLKLLGNTDAQLITSLGKGYFADGRRHPHAFSQLDPDEFLQWAEKMIIKE